MYLSKLQPSWIIIAYFGFIVVSEALSNGSIKERSAHKSDFQKSSVYNGHGSKHISDATTTSKQQSQNRGGFGLSAWGIIGVIGGSLLLGTFFYYATLFYPILCKKERKNQNQLVLDCCPSAPPALDSNPALSTPV